MTRGKAPTSPPKTYRLIVTVTDTPANGEDYLSNDELKDILLYPNCPADIEINRVKFEDSIE